MHQQNNEKTGHRILIVDDEESVLNLFADSLGERYECETATNAHEALKLMAERRRYKADLERRNSELAAQRVELVRLQAQLVHSEKMASLGQLAGGVAHELNNPAGFLYSNMETLVGYSTKLKTLLSAYEKLTLPERESAQIESLKNDIDYQYLLEDLSSTIADCSEGATRIHDIVLNLRTFSRLDEAELKMIDIHAGIDATIRLLSQYYSSSQITLNRDYGEQHDIPLLITDQRMPAMTGIELLKHTVSLRPQMVRIILTGYTDVDALVEAINCGEVYRYCTKPWNNEDLRVTVKRAIEHYETNKKRHELQLVNERLISRIRDIQMMAMLDGENEFMHAGV